MLLELNLSYDAANAFTPVTITVGQTVVKTVLTGALSFPVDGDPAEVLVDGQVLNATAMINNKGSRVASKAKVVIPLQTTNSSPTNINPVPNIPLK